MPVIPVVMDAVCPQAAARGDNEATLKHKHAENTIVKTDQEISTNFNSNDDNRDGSDHTLTSSPL